MPAPVYSTRFLAGRSTGTTQSYVVPSGKRAVIRFVSVSTFDATSEYFAVRVNGWHIYWRNAPAANLSVQLDARAVAFAGETISVASVGGDVAWHVAGYLFNDS